MAYNLPLKYSFDLYSLRHRFLLVVQAFTTLSERQATYAHVALRAVAHRNLMGIRSKTTNPFAGNH